MSTHMSTHISHTCLYTVSAHVYTHASIHVYTNLYTHARPHSAAGQTPLRAQEQSNFDMGPAANISKLKKNVRHRVKN